MKNSNSRDKNLKTQAPQPPSSASSNTNKLMRTDVYQPKQEQMERTNYNRPASGRKIQSGKNLPPKGPVPVAKKQYVVEDHMTESRIYEAKQGLQLLKKKMSSKGLSRQKITSNQQISNQKPISSLKSVGSMKGQETQYYQNRNSNNMPSKKIQKKVSSEQTYQSKPPTSSKAVPSSKNLNDAGSSKPTPQNDRKQPPAPKYEQYRDEEMEAPIKPKKDFAALLEEQLRKQKQGNNNSNYGKPNKNTGYNNNQMSQYPDENGELIQCRYCERKFGEAAIEKHEKICLKVFQTKRKAFDSAAHRAPEVQGLQKVQTQSKKAEPQKQAPKKQQAIPKKEQQAIPKWKAASLAFRANLKQAKGAQLTAEQKKATDIAQGMVQCNFCGRKFNQNAAARHIPFCETKSKQLPKTNTRKK